jgi:hypothetical protein
MFDSEAAFFQASNLHFRMLAGGVGMSARMSG